MQTPNWCSTTMMNGVKLKMRKSETTSIKEKSEDVRVLSPESWHTINWYQVNKVVTKLQARIVKAQKKGQTNKVKSLSRILTRSFSGKATAVKQVTSNDGAKTPGVDGIIWKTPNQRADAIGQLTQKGYKAKPLRRVYIDKGNGKKRPLGIPTMRDRAMQALYLLALDPVAECTADEYSFGFRKKRSCFDAVDICFKSLSRKNSSQWILEGDIKGCFDNISHNWLLTNIPMEKRMLRKWLKAGHVEKNSFYRPEDGTPQGGIISPVLANMTLDGLENLLYKRFKKKWRYNRKEIWGTHFLTQNPQMNFIRYADDFVITCNSKELLEKKVIPVVKEFMKERGLMLSPEKTLVTNINDGFDFLSFNIRKYGKKLLIKPSKKSVKKIKSGIKDIISNNKTVPAHKLIEMLNPKLRGWCNYHKHVVSKATFKSIENYCWQRIWKWTERRHSKKKKNWICNKYYTSIGKRNWIFFGDRPDGIRRYIFFPTRVKIVRHVAVVKDSNPYDPKWREYFDERDNSTVKSSLQCSQIVKKLWSKQKGICPLCGTRLGTGAEWGVYECPSHIHHVQTRKNSGSDEVDNLMLLHANCHRSKHAIERTDVPGDNNEAL